MFDDLQEDCLIDDMELKELIIDKETSTQLLRFLEHLYISAEYNKIHELIKLMRQFTETK